MKKGLRETVWTGCASAMPSRLSPSWNEPPGTRLIPGGATPPDPSSAMTLARHLSVYFPGQSIPAFQTIWRLLPKGTPVPTWPLTVKTGTSQLIPPSADTRTVTVTVPPSGSARLYEMSTSCDPGRWLAWTLETTGGAAARWPANPKASKPDTKRRQKKAVCRTRIECMGIFICLAMMMGDARAKAGENKEIITNESGLIYCGRASCKVAQFLAWMRSLRLTPAILNRSEAANCHLTRPSATLSPSDADRARVFSFCWRKARREF